MTLRIDPKREFGKGMTGIMVFGIDDQGNRRPCDIAELDADSLTNWLTRDSESNPLAENVIRIILGHPQIAPDDKAKKMAVKNDE
jgi:hypothetical protein